MALVDYSDSDSDSETAAQPSAAVVPPTSTATAAKKPIQKVVDRSNPRKILVNLGATGPDEAKTAENSDEPPAKRARTGGGVFGGFASLLPPPKNAGKPAVAGQSGKAAPRPGINLRTGATPGFSRSTGDDEEKNEHGESTSRQPSIPEGQKPADEVKLVGKPLMFRPLSVSRKPGKKNLTKSGGPPKAAPANGSPTAQVTATPEAPPKEQAPKKKVSLFSISNGDAEVARPAPSSDAYEPMFTEHSTNPADHFAQYDAQYSDAYSQPANTTANLPPQSNSLDDIASDMNLSAAARRELFGRRGAPAPTQSATKVINFNTDQEYAHNEELRAAGEQQAYNPVRAIAPGKHNLRQLVNQVHNQREALEESFAKGKSNQKEAGQRYGWR